MKKTSHFIMLSLAAVLLAAACKSKKKETIDPLTVTKAFYESLAKKDFAGAEKYVTADSKQLLDDIKKIMTGMAADTSVPKNPDGTAVDVYSAFKGIAFEQPVITGTDATVKGTQTATNLPVTVTLKKEGDEWKIKYNPPSF